jgi:hypothetical protein
MPTLLEVVYSLPPVALAHLFPDQPCHHTLNPLLADDSILCSLQSDVVIVVDTVECGRDLWLLGQEQSGLRCRHCGVWVLCEIAWSV